MAQYNVYALGNALLDIEYHSTEKQLKELSIEKGIMTLIDHEQHQSLVVKLGDSHEKMACGGSAANSLIALCDFGGTASFGCRVADDSSGHYYIEDLKKSNVESNAGEHLHQGHTGQCLVFVTPDADRTMNTYLGASAELTPHVVDQRVIENADYVYLEGYLVTGDDTRNAAIKAHQIAQQSNTKVALTLSDPAMVQFFRKGILEMMGDGVDLLFANEEEMLQLAQTQHFEEAVENIKSYCKSFAITRGAKGALVFDGENTYEVEPYEVTAIDTLGAGDSFAGAFLYGITHGMDFAQAGKLASMTSSKLVTQFGPRLHKSEIKQLLAEFNTGI
ncbi:MAG: adenosine kinase [Gammaproteobacteria bacterium]|nr:adenosine kinase [Gammaproteobacteria bacterium]